ncbi:MAG TPA: 3-hydroxyacyl-CoA dehydrogenase NAD-binding domain-containing protein [Solirubrobacterales bacterium]|jgi:3-hydroxybutyryl-CoA dehydrogenase/5-formyl-3-hydroxy-2-methylpyridine 4-carboxylate dehydrogenase|nr:3-hydroxyacyl-CoA dehydrogenase NAD-binding domain-containing protein [Solirubrobacterales bacterium]
MSEIRRAAVIGTGTMGPGMGAVLERAGIEVALHDVSEEAIERAKGGVELARGVLERLGSERADGGGLRFETELSAALDGVDFVLEAVPEKLELKQEVFGQFEQQVSDDAVLSSNTSGIPITKIAEELDHPERVIGLHWSNPPQLIPMIEVIPGEQTSEETVVAAKGLIDRIGYYPSLLRKEVPGFVENRVLYAIMRECLALVDEGVIDAEELDLNVKWGIGYKLAVIPPMQLLDVAGLDIYESVAGYLNSELSTESGVSETITKLTGEGKLGLKTGGGLFQYSEEELAELPKKRAAALVAVRKTLDGQDI